MHGNVLGLAAHGSPQQRGRFRAAHLPQMAGNGVAGYPRFQAAVPPAAAELSVLFHPHMADLRRFVHPALIDTALRNDGGAHAGAPFEQQQILLRPPQAINQLGLGKGLDVVFQQHGTLQRLSQRGSYLHGLIPDAVSMGADALFPVHRAGHRNARPQQLFPADAVFPEQGFAHIGHPL